MKLHYYNDRNWVDICLILAGDMCVCVLCVRELANKMDFGGMHKLFARLCIAADGVFFSLSLFI